MTDILQRDSVLLDRFRAFYAEIIKFKYLVTTGSVVGKMASGAERDTTNLDAGTMVWYQLLGVLEAQELDNERLDDERHSTLYRDTQYVMAALADEIFLNMDWEGRSFWTTNLLESKLFRTHAAGELFFRKLDRILQAQDPFYEDLAAVYLMALSLGFKGKFRGFDDKGQLERYRRKLFQMMFQRDPDLRARTRALFPNTYAFTLREGGSKRIPDKRIWILILCTLILLWILLSHGIWLSLTDRLNEVNKELLNVINMLNSM